MNISQFNEALSKLVGKAKRYEKAGDLEEAIESWLKVSEFTLKVSKIRNLDESYRKMLINRTDGIIAHIKDLKNELNKPKRKETPPVEESTLPSPPQESEEPEPPEETSSTEEEKSEKKPKLKQKMTTNGSIKLSKKKNNPGNPTAWEFTPPKKDPPKNLEILENSEFKNLPNGVKPIKPSNDFKVITPYDSEVVRKRLSGEIDTPPKSGGAQAPNDEDIQTKRKIICFACGEVNPFDSDTCKNCGTKLKK